MTRVFKVQSLRLLIAFVSVAAGPAVAATTTAAAPDDTVARGKYLAVAGDCVACHSAPGGKPYAGGLYLTSPFGRISTPNLTPDKRTGIGNWSDEQFYRAMHTGIDNAGDHLYPAFPYQWYTRVSREDVLAIKAYLFSLAPENAPRKPNEMVFPFNVRAGIAGWNALYFHAGTFQPDASKPAQWNRGAYLVEGLGHCAACHTPRNAAQGLIDSEAYAGGMQDDWAAPNITSDPKQGIGGWTEDALVHYLKKGVANGRGAVQGPMAQTVHDSLAHLTDPDLHAIAFYLKSIPAKSSYKPSGMATSGTRRVGADVYLSYCAACHQANGEGLAGAVPPLAHNGAVIATGPQDVVRAVLGGLPAQANLAPMPGFATVLTAGEIADVTNYVRTSWGNGAPATATQDMVASLAPKSASMLAGTHWCDTPADSPLGRAIANPSLGVQDSLRNINAGNELPQIRQVVAKLRHKVPAAKPDALVNDLTAAYCLIVMNNAAVPASRRAPALDRFASLTYTAVAAQK
jgi:mono/diheme cytochrome c family protein